MERLVLGRARLLTGIILFAAALAASNAMAVIVAPSQFSGIASPSQALLSLCASDSCGGCDADSACVPPTGPEDRSQQQPGQLGKFLADATTTGAGTSTSSPAGSGAAAAAILNQIAHVELGSLEASLPRDPTIILPSGPPFELLRPA